MRTGPPDRSGAVLRSRGEWKHGCINVSGTIGRARQMKHTIASRIIALFGLLLVVATAACHPDWRRDDRDHRGYAPPPYHAGERMP